MLGAKAKVPHPKKVVAVVKTAKPSKIPKPSKSTAKERSPLKKSSKITQLETELQTLKKEMKVVKRKEDGPKVQKTMAGLFNIGIVNGPEKGLELQRAFHLNLNPVLMKDTGSGNAPTPLATEAVQYAKWRYRDLQLVVLPKIGTAMVGGTTMVISLDNDAQAASPLDLDNILARKVKHEIDIGQRARTKFPVLALRGPLEGWWAMNTNESPNTTCNLAIDVHTYGEAFNLLSTSSGSTAMYNGPLWQIQIRYTIELTGYENKPGMLGMLNDTIPVEDATLISTEDGLVIKTSTKSLFNQKLAVGENYTKRRANQSGPQLSQRIFQMAGDVAGEVASTIGGPWGWLLKGGLWFLRKVLTPDGSNDGEAEFVVYPSIADAQQDKPITDAGLESPVELPMENAVLTQINNHNLLTPDLPGSSSVPGIVEEYPLPIGAKGKNILLANNGLEIPKGSLTGSILIAGTLSSYKTSWEKSKAHTGSLTCQVSTSEAIAGTSENSFQFGYWNKNPTIGYGLGLFVTKVWQRGIDPEQVPWMAIISHQWNGAYKNTDHCIRGDFLTWIKQLEGLHSATTYHRGWYRMSPIASETPVLCDNHAMQVFVNASMTELNDSRIFSGNTWVLGTSILRYFSWNFSDSGVFFFDADSGNLLFVGATCCITTSADIVRKMNPATAWVGVVGCRNLLDKSNPVPPPALSFRKKVAPVVEESSDDESDDFAHLA
uniref:Capsid protein n=1 Tax=Beihai tree frog astrovirus TaxID=2116129 RepID=A0A2P1GNG2_9VIRU|nr:capsid protein [Beihai tree frog astrovirus]